jgi:hypothetical protein
MLVQSIVFPKTKFSQSEALKWLIKHNYKHHKIDITPNTYRFRQHEPWPGGYYSKTLENGVILIIIK